MHPATTSAGKLPCTLSLDLDDAWTYLRAAGRPGFETTRGVVPLVCERLLDTLARWNVKATLFVIARDLEDDAKVAAIRPLVDDGHEIGCHSHWHDPEFARHDAATLRREIHGAADLIERRLGVRPRGFRAPGFARNKLAPALLADAGFEYDGSYLPTFLGPIARTYYFLHAGMSREEKQRRKAMFGGFLDVFGHLRGRPHRDAPSVFDLPVSTMPLLRLPFHLSYVQWLGGKWPWLARRYLGLGLSLCRLTRLPPSYLLHSLDFVGRGEHHDLDFFPGMDVTWEHKRAFVEHLMAQLTKHFAVMPLGQFVAAQRPGTVVS